MGDIVTREVFDHLLDHMLEVHRKKLNIISAYTHDYDSYVCKLNFLNSYIKGIEAFLEGTSVGKASDELPFVILGSVVEILQPETNKRARIRITLPKEGALPDEENVEIHTCFSDLGHAMLLKRVGDQVEGGPHVSKYLITRIVSA